MTTEKTERIFELLQALPDQKLESLKRLFWEELNYNHADAVVSTAGWPEDLPSLFVETPRSFATTSRDESFHILYCHLNSEKLLVGTERQIIQSLIKDYPYSLFVFSNLAQDRWHFVNAIQNQDKKNTKQRILRRISISQDDRLRTASERIALLDVARAEADPFGIDPIKIQQQHEDAFNVEAVTEEFFNEYKSIFTGLKDALHQQTQDLTWAHDFSLQFLNRLMFIYYIERKRWLGDNPDFLHDFWREYLKSRRGSDTFIDAWVNILFFEAFNNRFAAGRSDLAYIPEAFRNALQLAPYLNGGLFSKNDLDEKHTCHIPDSMIQAVLAFLDKYNFTISEDTPLDQEVAVDPEMIGKVYESLVNVSEEADEQGDAGIFYTPRIEIDLMCRLCLVDWFANHLPEVDKNFLYEMVFAFSESEKQEADARLATLDLWNQIDSLLNEITVLDPACGSGSFLVGMLTILDDLIVRASAFVGRSETPYARRKRIIGNSLYGVDIMEWAVHVAELRLWLQLIIETELDLGERRSHPLLPNLSFKIRQGDSLVQEVGGLNLSLYRQGSQLTRATAQKLNALKEEKLKFFQNDPTCRYHTKAQVEQDELQIFNQIIADQHDALRQQQVELTHALAPRKNLFGQVQDPQMDLNAVTKAKTLEQIETNLQSLQQTKAILQSQRAVPFVWDIAFVEIFEGDRQGFDIVIGNPPYTRQESIRDLALTPEAVTPANKRAYKEKLAQAVYTAWPHTFGYHPATGNADWSLDRKSDLYIYFYLVSLSLLNPQGSFCFITSNSWLDVGYGKDLQRFLLTRGEVKLVIDNQVKRSFKNADVNTIIILLGKPVDSPQERQQSLQTNARFVMFKVPFEEGLSPVLWEEIETITDKHSTQEYKALVKRQADLLDAGRDAESGAYAGDKWGGKYLRAPDIYWYILEKCADKLVRLGDIADVRRGITTGANAFFYLDEEKIAQWGIEEEFLVPVLTSTRYLNGYIATIATCNKYALNCKESKSKLKGTNVIGYIKDGENKGFHKRPSCRNRNMWYAISDQEPADFIMLRFRDIRNWTPIISDEEFLIGDTVFIGYHKNKSHKSITNCLLNSSFQIFISELYGRSNLGEGLLTTYGPEINNFLIFNPIVFKKVEKQLLDYFEPIFERNVHSVFDEFNAKDRKRLDSLIFQSLGLSSNLVDELYYETINLINLRRERADIK